MAPPTFPSDSKLHMHTPIPQQMAVQSVRRRLFPAANYQQQQQQEQHNEPNENNAEFLTSAIIARREEAKRKWNFDFENDAPLEGDWEWERVDGDDFKLD